MLNNEFVTSLSNINLVTWSKHEKSSQSSHHDMAFPSHDFQFAELLVQ